MLTLERSEILAGEPPTNARDNLRHFCRSVEARVARGGSMRPRTRLTRFARFTWIAGFIGFAGFTGWFAWDAGKTGFPVTAVFAQTGAQRGQWPTYGGDPGSTKYSPLDQINRSNVRQLQVAWR